MVYLSADSHPSKYSNLARCQLTTLIEDNAPTTTLKELSQVKQNMQ